MYFFNHPLIKNAPMIRLHETKEVFSDSAGIIYIYIYIYIERERERELCLYVLIHIYI